MADLLRIEDLHYHYGANHALKGITLTVSAGEIVALLGSNGAGKTTTLRCVSGLLRRPSAGRILFQGENITAKRAERIARPGIETGGDQDQIRAVVVGNRLQLGGESTDDIVASGSGG